MKNQILEIDGTRWLVREALSERHAFDAIAHARVMGSVGQKDTLNNVEGTVVMADIHQINSDNTLRQPYTRSY